MSKRLAVIRIISLLAIILLSGCVYQPKNKWALDLIQIYEMHALGFSGKGIRIGIIDTGVDLKLGNFDERRFIAWKDLINCRDYFYDDNGHGTFIASLLFSKPDFLGYGLEGICPDCEVIVVKAVSELGESNDTIISKAIDFCIENHADIILLSLYKNQEGIEIGEESIEKCEEALDKGIFIVAPAGDDGLKDDGDVFILSSIDYIISAGSIGRDLYISPFSSRGNQAEVLGKHEERVDPNKKPELVAPGEGIEGVYGNGFAKRSGTSISSAFVAGSIALLLEAYPELKRSGIEKIEIVKDILARTAKKIGDVELYGGKDLKHNDRYGYGVIQVYDAYKMLGGVL